LKHELLHICFNHLDDREQFPNQELHNIAADLEINQYLTPEYYPTPDIILLTSFPELNLPEKAGTKVYYGLLQQALDAGTSPSLQELMDGLCGSEECGGGLHPTWKEFDGMSEADAKLAKWLEDKAGKVTAKKEGLTKAQEAEKAKALKAEKVANDKRAAAAVEAAKVEE
jgi:hypothetical protein